MKKQQFLFLFFACLFCFSCHDKELLKQAIIEKTVRKKLEAHKRQRIANCNKKAMEEAIEKADSFMIQIALSQIDTSSRANRPVKPTRPDINFPVDTIPIKPLFKE